MTTRRQFIGYCCLGVCGFAGLNPLDSFAGFFDVNKSAASPAGEPGKWSKEALFYEVTADGIRCRKCPHECLLGVNDTGLCRNRVNHRGKLYSTAYGNPCAVHIDPIEKKPLFHFMPTTRAFSIAAAGCNLRCLNCQNWQISQFSPRDTKNFDLMPGKVVDECLSAGCESIAYTYSEPTTFYEYTYDTAEIAKGRGIKNVLKSSGYINETPLRSLCRVLDGANIDLKNFDDKIYRKLSSAALGPVLQTLKVLKEENVWLEITNLVIPGWTDDLDMIKRMSDWLCRNGLSDCPLHFSRFTPLYKLTQLPVTPVSTLEKARDAALKSGIKYVYLGNVPAHPAENTYCPKCRKMIIERRGFAILLNDIVKGKCRYCGEKIPGVWA
jgi:pyruvate formate lyase activating enzyme